MKLDINSKLNRFQKRALQDFSNGMLKLLQKQSFESITVNTICEYCNYPRSTFYNYFEDLYDLLDYCWYATTGSIFQGELLEIAEEERQEYMVRRIFRFMKEREENLNQIMKYNEMDGIVMQSLQKYIHKVTLNLVGTCSLHQDMKVPREMYAAHVTNTAVLTIEWAFLKKDKLTEDQALEYYNYLLGNS